MESCVAARTMGDGLDMADMAWTGPRRCESIWWTPDPTNGSQMWRWESQLTDRRRDSRKNTLNTDFLCRE
jgi:hypothetical protein